MRTVRQFVLGAVACIALLGATGFGAAQVLASSEALSGQPSSFVCPDCKPLCGIRGGYQLPGGGCSCCLPPN